MTDWLILGLLAALLALGLLLALLGAGLLTRRSTTTDQPPRRDPTERQWRIERWVYRYHRAFGSLVIAVSVLFFFKTWLHGLLFAGGPAWQAAWWLLALGMGLNLVIGLVLVTRPSRLKPLEQLSNRWVHVDAATLARLVVDHPHLSGLLLVALSLFAVAGIGGLVISLLGNL